MSAQATPTKRVAVIGAGMAGLSAAFRLQEAGAEPVLFDRADAPGGRTRTVRQNGFVLDVGAGVLPATYVDVARLIADAGLDHLTEAVGGYVGTPKDGRLHLLDMRKPKLGLLTSGLLGWPDKLRLLRLIRKLRAASGTLGFDTTAAAAPFDTETIAQFADRELGPRLREYFIEPLIRALYLHDAESASIVTLLWCLKNLASDSSFAIRGGMDALARDLATRFEVHHGVDVLAVRREADGCELSYSRAGNEIGEAFDGCVCAVDGHDALGLLALELSQRQQAFLANLRYSTSVNLHYQLSSPPANPALIIQVPRAADSVLAALVQDHLKGSGRTPDGAGLVSAFFVTGWGERMWDRSDAEAIADATPRIAGILPGFEALVQDVHVERWRRAATICPVGHYRELAAFESALDPNAPIQLASDVFAPSSVNVAVRQGARAAARLLRRFGLVFDASAL